MADREEILREKTFKEPGMELEKRIFYTLRDNQGLAPSPAHESDCASSENIAR